MSGGNREERLAPGLREASRAVRAGSVRPQLAGSGHGGSDPIRDLGANWKLRFTFTQAICQECYDRRYPGRPPVRVKPDFADVEQCCDCGSFSADGIYMRLDPRTVQYPRRRGDDSG